jgi:hypothetical protein
VQRAAVDAALRSDPELAEDLRPLLEEVANMAVFMASDAASG